MKMSRKKLSLKTKKIIINTIIIILTIAIPLAITAFVADYGFNKRYNPNSEYADKTITDQIASDLRSDAFIVLMEGATFPRERIQKYVGYRSQKYNPTPIYEETIYNDNNEKLFNMVVYDGLWKRIEEGVEYYDIVSPQIYIYDVQYGKIKEEFEVDPTVIEDIEDIELSVKFTIPYKRDSGVADEERQYSFADVNGAITDTGSDLNTKQVQACEFRAALRFAETESITVNFNAKITITSSNIVDQVFKSINLPINSDASTRNLDNFEEGLNSSFDSIIEPQLKAVVFKKYVWWQCLIALVVSSVVIVPFGLSFILPLKEEK
jgi:hypothetical protein